MMQRTIDKGLAAELRNVAAEIATAQLEFSKIDTSNVHADSPIIQQSFAAKSLGRLNCRFLAVEKNSSESFKKQEIQLFSDIASKTTLQSKPHRRAVRC